MTGKRAENISLLGESGGRQCFKFHIHMFSWSGENTETPPVSVSILKLTTTYKHIHTLLGERRLQYEYM